jgi:hypothetical protein
VWTVEFWKAVAERAVWTFAQALLGILTIGATGLLSTPWLPTLSAAGVAALVAVLKAITANYVTGNGPSLGSSEHVTIPAVDTHGRHELPE